MPDKTSDRTAVELSNGPEYRVLANFSGCCWPARAFWPAPWSMNAALIIGRVIWCRF